MAKADKMYKSAPKMERDGEDGKMKVTKAEKESARTNDGTEGMPIHEMGATAPHIRHSMERGMMHHRHETEHTMHDNGKTGDKKDMHVRHIKEMSDMYKRHEKELSGSGKEKINKV